MDSSHLGASQNSAPQNKIWGPALWMILHSLAERVGSISLNRLPQEETRLWTVLLGSLRYSLPCPQCKRHYTEYFQRRPLVRYTKEAIRTWLFDLHQEINERNGVNTVWSLEHLEEAYSQPFHFSLWEEIVVQQMMLGLRRDIVRKEDVQRTMRAFVEMRRFYDLF